MLAAVILLAGCARDQEAVRAAQGPCLFKTVWDRVRSDGDTTGDGGQTATGTHLRYRWRHDRKRRSIRHRLPPRSASHRRRSRVPRPLPEMPSRAVVQGGASFVAHLASFKIKDKANQFMHTVTKKYDLGGKSVRVNKVKIAKKGTWYRVVVGTFSSLQDAIIFCQQAGKFNADCEVLNKGGKWVRLVPGSV